MGGLGSGKGSRTKRSKKLKTCHLLGLDVPQAVKMQQENPTGSLVLDDIDLKVNESHILLERTKGDRLKTDSIKLALLPCNYGGVQYLGHCPACQRRVRTLYLFQNFFACRTCFKMAYPSQNQTLYVRLLLKSDKAKKKINNDPWTKPKWMRQKTFKRLRSEQFELEEKRQLADFFSLRNNREVDRIYKKYPMAILAAEEFGMRFLKDAGTKLKNFI
jgi:hypothetical protein